MNRNTLATLMAVASGVALSGCVHESQTQAPGRPTCEIMANPPVPTKAAIGNAMCPASTEVYLSAVFKDGAPVGVGGGTDAGTGNKSDKVVKGGQNICWVATDEAGGASNQDFDIIFSPSDNPNPNQHYQSVNIFPNAPSGIEFKYTVWAGEGECQFFDPRFFIN